MSLWFLRSPSGARQEADFSRPGRHGGESPGELVDARFESDAGMIESFAEGRALGDCGEHGAWAWDGERFVLLGLRALPECRGVGPDAWPVLYRSRRR
ncbi:MAG: DUF1176 domain-containing protein [Xanthomonadales bacterium]|nr:DUF1176 domain-containing protein [Xanthomonadales bacterium]